MEKRKERERSMFFFNLKLLNFKKTLCFINMKNNLSHYRSDELRKIDCVLF